MKQLILAGLVIISMSIPAAVNCQSFIGINTSTPDRTLDVEGEFDQYARIHCSSNGTGEAALELILGNNISGRDFKLTNDDGIFRVMVGTDNFLSAGTEIMRIDEQREVGIGTSNPVTQLHIDNGEDASNTDDGFLMLGTESGTNLVMDNNEILVRNNGTATGIQLQSHGGNTLISNEGGNAYFGEGGGNLSLGTTSVPAEVNIDNEEWQIMLRNTANGVRNWFIGASNLGWSISDNQLVFSPKSSSSSSVLRLMDISENGGVIAPVIINSSADQVMLFDGNEIDGKDDAIYINHNSNQETYINPSGGRVGVGVTEANTTLHINRYLDIPALRLERDGVAWEIDPDHSVDWLGFRKDGWVVGHVDGASGQWVTISDKRLKSNIQPMADMLPIINQIKTWTYSFIHDDDTRHIGVIAQEIMELIPEIVSHDNDMYHVANSKLSVILLKGLQEQQKQIDQLQSELLQLINQ